MGKIEIEVYPIDKSCISLLTDEDRTFNDIMNAYDSIRSTMGWIENPTSCPECNATLKDITKKPTKDGKFLYGGLVLVDDTRIDNYIAAIIKSGRYGVTILN